MKDIKINLEVNLGRVDLSLGEIKKFEIGSIIDLQVSSEELVTFTANDLLIGEGEIMVQDKNLELKINNIFFKEGETNENI